MYRVHRESLSYEPLLRNRELAGVESRLDDIHFLLTFRLTRAYLLVLLCAPSLTTFVVTGLFVRPRPLWYFVRGGGRQLVERRRESSW